MFDCTLYIFDDFAQLENNSAAYSRNYIFCTPPELGGIAMTGRYKRSMIVEIFHNLHLDHVSKTEVYALAIPDDIDNLLSEEFHIWRSKILVKFGYLPRQSGSIHTLKHT